MRTFTHAALVPPANTARRTEIRSRRKRCARRAQEAEFQDHLPVPGSLNLQHNLPTPSASSLLQGFLLLLQPLRRSHVFYDGSHGSNFKLLKIRGFNRCCITKAREVTKARNFLGLMFG